MSNKISEKYFEQEDFSKREKEVLTEVTAKTGFEVEKEIFRGVIYQSDKVGSVIYLGKYKGKPAVLKLQGLRPEIDEIEIIKHFESQNQSRLVRLPKLYDYKLWNAESGYGYLITEYIDASKIFTMPFASLEDMKEFAMFYEEYRTSALTHPWIKPETTDSLLFTAKRMDNWRKISESKKKLKLEDYTPYLMRYYPLAIKHLPSIPMVFCHGHLTANDIYKLPGGTFLVLSNLFWSYRPQWYDLSFNIWACLQNIRNTDYTFEEMTEYIGQWLSVYREIGVVKKDSDFDRKMNILLLERAMGAILVDLGVNDFYDKKENEKYYHHLLNLHQRLFVLLAQKLENP